MNIGEIIKKYLQEHGYDGLVCSEGECACEIDDLFPCQCMDESCKPAYKWEDNIMSTRKQERKCVMCRHSTNCEQDCKIHKMSIDDLHSAGYDFEGCQYYEEQS